MNSPLPSAKIYTSIQSLQTLKNSANAKQNGTKEVAQQFEALFLQSLLKSMRTGNQHFNSKLLNNNQTELYQDLYDKQLSLHISNSGIGLAKIIERQLNQMNGMAAEKNTNNATAPSTLSTQLVTKLKSLLKKSPMLPAPAHTMKELLVNLPNPAQTQAPTDNTKFSSKLDFLKELIDEAISAGKLLGVHPKVLLAQAALETAWGRSIMRHSNGDSSHNLFGIKADKSWQKSQAMANTHEYRNGKMQRERASFRSYASFADSFNDYVNFLQVNPRYRKALTVTHDPTAYTQELQRAGYATDPKYAAKINQIMNSSLFKQFFNNE